MNLVVTGGPVPQIMFSSSVFSSVFNSTASATGTSAPKRIERYILRNLSIVSGGLVVAWPGVILLAAVFLMQLAGSSTLLEATKLHIQVVPNSVVGCIYADYPAPEAGQCAWAEGWHELVECLEAEACFIDLPGGHQFSDDVAEARGDMQVNAIRDFAVLPSSDVLGVAVVSSTSSASSSLAPQSSSDAWRVGGV